MTDFHDVPLNKIALKSAWDVKSRDEKDIPSFLSKKDHNYNGFCRGLEYKIWYSHSDKNHFSSDLTAIRAWITENANYMQPLFLGIYLENKGTITDDKEQQKFIHNLHQYLDHFLGKENLFTPKNLMDWFKTEKNASCTNLPDCIQKHGWPTIKTIGPRIIVCLIGQTNLKNIYQEKFSTEKSLCFYDIEVRSDGYIIEGTDTKHMMDPYLKPSVGIFSFMNRKNLQYRDKKSYMDYNLKEFITRNMLTRFYSNDEQDEEEEMWCEALQLGVNILTTTRVSGHKFAAVNSTGDLPYRIYK